MILHTASNDKDPGCAHAQQLLWQLFNAIEKGYAAAGDTDTAFLDCTFYCPPDGLFKPNWAFSCTV